MEPTLFLTLHVREACLFYIAYIYLNVPRPCILLNAPQVVSYSLPMHDRKKKTYCLCYGSYLLNGNLSSRFRVASVMCIIGSGARVKPVCPTTYHTNLSVLDLHLLCYYVTMFTMLVYETRLQCPHSLLALL
uniref:Uncharacterized protein n=1 Tax=Oncorhynchus mykiss TaxID=8022 RepID=A0A8K9URY8_ONCMY